MDVKVFRKISDIPESHWSGIFSEAPLSYPFLKTLDSLNFPQFDFYYVMFYDGPEPQAATTLFLMKDFHLDMAVSGALKYFIRLLRKIFPRFLCERVLFCGLIYCIGKIGIKENPQGAMEALVGAMEGLAKKEKAGALVFKDFDASYGPIFEPLFSRGFVRMKSFPNAVLKINFDSFEAYLKTLSPSSRQGFRRKLKKISANPPFDFEITDTVSPELSAQMHGLYLETMRHAEVEFEELPRDYFSAFSRSMPGRVKYFLWRLNGKLIIFAQCFTEGRHFIDYYLGFDYSVSHKYNLYLVRFKKLLEWCMENGVKTYEIGQSSYEIKRRLGFEFLPLYVYSRPCNKAAAFLSVIFHRFLAFERFEPALRGQEGVTQ
jgi:predicted N-acyltransferase